MRRLIACATLAAVLTWSSGCATISAGGLSTLEVDARENHPNATIVLREEGGKRVGKPQKGQARYTLSKHHAYRVEVGAPGHTPGVYVVERHLQQVFWLNAVPLVFAPLVAALGLVSSIATGPQSFYTGLWIAAGLGAVGLTGLAVDASTGNAWHHEPSRIRVDLAPVE
jgi:hypothetical protein